MSERVCIVGAGRAGLALGAALRRTGTERLTFLGRSLDPPPHPVFEPGAAEAPPAEYRLGPVPLPEGTTVLLLAVPDDALAEVAWEMAGAGHAPAGCAALHLSGALSTDVLAPLHGAGYAIGSMFPLLAIADPWQPAERLLGAAFAISGEPAAVAAARRLIDPLDGLALVLAPTLRPLFHAAITLASGGLVALLARCAALLEEAGARGDDAVAALLPLVRGTLDNLEKLGLRAALTGPIATGDADAVRMHLSRLSHEDRALYSALGRELLRLARGAGLDPHRADDVEAALSRN